MPKDRSITLGVIVGNRNFFPDALVTEGRRDVLEILAERGIEPVILDEQSTKLGGVETWKHAKKCAALLMINVIGLMASSLFYPTSVMKRASPKQLSFPD